MGADCKSAGNAYAGSNPARPKKKRLASTLLQNSKRGGACLSLTQSKGGSCEARRIVDSSTMGSSLFDPVKRRVLRSKTNRRSFDDGSFCSLKGSRTLLFLIGSAETEGVGSSPWVKKPKVNIREEGSGEARRIADPSTMGSSLPFRCRRQASHLGWRSLWLSPKVKGKRVLRRADQSTK